MRRGATAAILGALSGGAFALVLPRPSSPVPDTPRCQPAIVVVPSDCVRVLADVPRRPLQPRRSRLDPPAPEPETRDDLDEGVLDAFQACADPQGHRVVVDCEVWPCIVGIAYASTEAFDAVACRDRLPPELPTETGMNIAADGSRFHWRQYYLAHGSLTERWKDQAWRELATARKELVSEALSAAVWEEEP